ncbi:YdhK family protein [Neobacillus sp. SuZ13]|uniref:YdhK family protein n=1 Tax=Neobacillus sp. SuZ13 TaxID=3047875 RepID=UPI0024C01A53|nr:YdhK family protein [Neobacillus sp. SuZ13]WHY68449.1 YdhK family protein [Neobacillus sp. SuZ13]
MKSKKLLIGIVSLILMLMLAACSNNNDDKSSDNSNMDHGNMKMDDKNSNKDDSNTDDSSMDMGDMDHSGTGEVPEGLKEANNPTYKVGTNAIVHSEHMEGMNGAKATIVGAYDTVVYAVTYTPTTGGEPVKNHKWVIQEEIKDAGTKTLEPGTKVTLNADHMEGMMGATGTIDSAEKTTVYMIDYTPTNGGEKVTNHQWVTESELSAK